MQENTHRSQSSATRFVILTRPRCGSTYLATTLNSHPEILCHGELFYKEAIFYAADYRRNGLIDLGSVQNRDQSPVEFLDRVWAQHFDHNILGFKFVAGQNTQALHFMLSNPFIKKIVLRRRNNIKKFVSHKIAHLEKQWTHYKYQFSKTDFKAIQIEVNPKELNSYLLEDNAFYNEILERMHNESEPYQEVYYEDLLASPEPMMGLLDCLGVDNVDTKLEAATIKRNSTDLSHLISNFKELAVQFKNTQFESDLYETTY